MKFNLRVIPTNVAYNVPAIDEFTGTIMKQKCFSAPQKQTNKQTTTTKN